MESGASIAPPVRKVLAAPKKSQPILAIKPLSKAAGGTRLRRTNDAPASSSTLPAQKDIEMDLVLGILAF